MKFGSATVQGRDESYDVVFLKTVLEASFQLPVSFVDHDYDSGAHAARLHKHFLFFLEMIGAEQLNQCTQVLSLVLGVTAALAGLQNQINGLLAGKHHFEAACEFHFHFHNDL